VKHIRHDASPRAQVLTGEQVGAIRRAIDRCNRALESIAAKRSWRPAEKAMASAEYTRDIEALREILLDHGVQPEAPEPR